MPKQKYYVVWKGKRTGIFTSWDDCKKQVHGFDNAQYKSFKTKEEAEAAFQKNYWSVVEKKGEKKKISDGDLKKYGAPIQDSISVDAASSGNPGIMEYQGVHTQTKKKIFKKGPFKQGTNNVGEFLALVHGLVYAAENPAVKYIYSDSKIAIGWVKKGKCNTKLKQTAVNKRLFDLVAVAEKWLAENNFSTQILKWETKAWGEIPADFGRK